MRHRSAGALAVAALCLPGRAAADGVRILECDEDAARARIELIRSARHEIDVAYFIFGDDAAARTGLALLRDAARRGVKVRIVVDAYYNLIPYALRAHLEAEGIEIRDFHRFHLLTPRWWLRRMHDKLLIADGAELITGGRNVQSSYFGLHHGRNYVDRDVYVRGGAAQQAHAYFLGLWESKHVEPAGLSYLSARWRTLDLGRYTNPMVREHHAVVKQRAQREVTAAERELDGHAALLGVAAAAGLIETGIDGFTDGFREIDRVQFLSDRGGRKGRPGIVAPLGALVEGARASIVIESPYCIPSGGFLEALHRARARGVEVRILTNSLHSTDNLLAQAGYGLHRATLAGRYGVQLWEARGPASLHAKSMVVDGQVAVIGSINLNPRSMYYDTEVAVVVEDAALARELEAAMTAHLADAYRIGADGRPVGEGEVATLSAPRRILLRILRILAPLIHPQL